MIEVAVYEAKTRLSELLTEVEAGKTVVITRRGVAVAHLVSSKLPRSSAASQRQRVASVMRALAPYREAVALDIPLREAIEQGRD